jgi:hypothetical protein
MNRERIVSVRQAASPGTLWVCPKGCKLPVVSDTQPKCVECQTLMIKATK